MSQIAVVSNRTTRRAVRRPIPTPAAGQVLVRNVAVASNPKDWKGPAAFDDWQDVVEGNDVAGYVEAVGDGVAFKKGERVAGFSKMRDSSDAGAYQEYTLIPAHLVFPIFDAKFEEAATLPLAIMTAAIGLYRRLNLPLPSALPTPQDEWIFINGASSSVGSFALQLAKLSGLHVLATAGASADLVHRLGADDVLDRHALTPAQLQKALQAKRIARVFDAVSSPTTQKTIVDALQANGGGELAVVLPPIDVDAPAQVNLEPMVRVGTAYGANAHFAAEWYPVFGQWLAKGILKPNVVRLLPDGLESVDEGLRLLEAGKVSGEKLVYRIADTPQSYKDLP